MQVKTFPVLKKGGYQAAFFLQRIFLFCFTGVCLIHHCTFASTAITVEQIVTEAAKARLAEEPTWASLLHVADGKANIQNSDFLLSWPNFSLEQELSATIRFLYGGNKTRVCRYPARYLWIRKQIEAPELPIDACVELSEFKRRAPAHEIAVVFASENLAQPSSMMGHIMLKLSGASDEDDKKQVEHAVSFITDAGGLNLPKLFYDSMVVGKAGFFTLAPYDEKLQLYLREEQRSIWEYALQLNPAQRELIQAHLIELKQSKLTYFFQNYNCATVVDFIISIGAGQQLPVEGFWLTPKDVVKRAQALGLIKESRVVPPNRWLIRAIGEQLEPAERNAIKQHVDRFEGLPSDSSNINTEFIRLQLAKAYHGYRIESSQVAGAHAEAYSDLLNQMSEKTFKDKRLEAISFKNPINTPQDSQFEFGILNRQHKNFLRLSFTPASHHLVDDNRQYFGESELLLFDISVLKNVSTREVELDRFTLYGAKSLISRDDMSGGVSGAIALGIEPQLDASFRRHQTTYLKGSLGITKRYWADIDITALMGLGTSFRSGQLNIYAQPEIGIIVRELFNMKLTASVAMMANALADQSRYLKYRVVQSKFFQKQNVSLHLTAEFEKQNRHHQHSLELSIKYLF